MADNVKVDAGEGPSVATDEVGSAHYQYVKPAFGADNTATKVSTSDPLPTVDSAGNTLLTEIESAVDGLEALLTTIDADTGNLAGILTAVQTLDNAIAGNEMQMDIVSGGPVTTAIEAVKTSVDALIAGATIFRSLDIDESEEEVKGTAGRLLFYHYANRTAEELFLKFYNATAADVTVGSTAPVLTIPLAKESQGHVPLPKGGLVFSTAISVACVKGVADNNAEGPAANGCVINLGYA